MINTIINSFDTWTDAQGIKSRIRVNSVENISLEGIARLRELILELAVLGKLVPQDASDEPASVLLKKIENERKGSGTLKKRKKEEQPYEGQIFNSKISGWELCKLEDIGDTNIGLTYSPNDISDNGTIVLRSSNIQNGEIDLLDLVRVNKKINENVLVKQGDLLICARNGSKKLVGKCALIRSLPEPMAFGAFMAIFRSPFNEYCRLFVESPIYRRNLEGVTTTTINQITQDNLKNTYIPLPPFAEQHRIVAKVDELMALCDQLEAQQFNNLKTHQVLVKTLLETLTKAANANELKAAWERMAAHFDTLFCTDDSIEQLKQTILQLAVMGKLVRQDPNDEPAAELLKKIAKEKEMLIKEGKIKKEKEFPKISKEYFPFELPKCWTWCRFSEVGVLKRGKSKHRPRNDLKLFLGGIHPFIQTGEVSQAKRNNGLITSVNGYYNDFGLDQSEIQKAGTLCITIAANIAEYGFLGIDACVPDSIVCFNSVEDIISKYVGYFINISKDMLEKLAPATAQKNINLGILSELMFPLPPLAEINRIVVCVEEIFALCESLKEKIVKSQELKVLLAKTIEKKAVQ